MSEYPKFTSNSRLGAAYVSMSDKRPTETKDVGYGIHIDMDDAGDVVGVEILWDVK